jgi:hypothetical protein
MPTPLNVSQDIRSLTDFKRHTTEEEERAITIAGIQRGLDEIARGESQLFSEFYKEFKAEHGITEDAE